jgi:hypothetical protein
VLSDPPVIDPGVDVPEVPTAALLPLLALAMLAVGWAVRRRSAAA